MPAPILAGIASIKGMNGGTATFTGVTATLTPVTSTKAAQFEEEKLKDGYGSTVALGATDRTEDLDIELFITGADVATCRTLVEPSPNAVLTLASMPRTADNGTYNIKTFSAQYSENFAKVTMKATRYGAVGTAAALTVL